MNRISFNVEKGEILGIIGPNGSGKTTIFNLITGFNKSDSGEVFLEDRRLTHLPIHEISQMGVARTFQLTRVFKNMKVIDNLIIGGLSVGSDRNELRRKAIELLLFVKLISLKDLPAGTLSYGQQKLLEFARVLMREPKLILLDEPTAGLNPVITEQLLAQVKEVKAKGTPFIIIEHNMQIVKSICGRLLVVDHGEKLLEGTPEEIQQDQRVIDAYLGHATKTQ